MNEKRAWFYDLLFICVLLIAGFLRFNGAGWGEGLHQHPDELFLMGVLDNLRAHSCDDGITPVDLCPLDQRHWLSLGEYFDSAKSTLNPYNRGNAFFVYGNLPMTVARIALEATGNDNISDSKIFARQFSALADLFTIFILYLIVSNLYGRKVGLLASAFSAFTVMQIQQSHFFTSDLFVNLFMFLTLYFAVEIVNYRESGAGNRNKVGYNSQFPILDSQITSYKLIIVDFIRNPLFLLSVGFGIALGMAMASKINAASLAIMLPAVFAIRYLTKDRHHTSLITDYWKLIAIFLIAGGLATLISFRIFQPYAFSGLGLNPQWIDNIGQVRNQASGLADLPWNLQWARRTHLYSFTNLTLWGLGLPLGILAWTGFLFMGWRIIKGEWKHLLLWSWTAFYFLWQSSQFNPTMRYQLPIYPLLCMMAAWVVSEFRIQNLKFKIQNYAFAFIGIVVLAATAAWAFAFQSIYTRDETRVAASRWIFQNAAGPVNLRIDTQDNGIYNQPLPVPNDFSILPGSPFTLTFVPKSSGQISEVVLNHALDSVASPSTIALTLYSSEAPDVPLAGASQLVNFKSTTDPRGPSVVFSFEKTIPVVAGKAYQLKIESLGSGLILSGSYLANETDYDWGLPFRIDGYDAFGGIYRGDLILQVYWDDNTDKLARFIQTLTSADYIIIPTNHQYAQITRIPERYPLTTFYYRELLGCPQGADIIQCYRTAQPGQYQGNLGFELVKVFESYPTLGSWVINDQSAEEAFTFYDHPKVLIFKKTDQFDSKKISALLGTVDLTNVVHLLPNQAADYKNLMLPDSRLAQQRAGGTWSQLFNYDWIQNKYPLIGVVFWYVFIFLLGLIAYPITRAALPGFRQYSYPFSRIVGLALLAWISWMGASIGIPYSRVSIGAAFLIIAGTGFGLWWMRKQQFKDEWNDSRRFFTLVEIVFVVFFLIDLLIRIGNPDMWHPSKGGERPMDFSYFNAVLKSTSFPPYDPWFAGGYINYYYYGFVLAGTPVKLLGIVPSIAYNFILPTWYALIAIGAFGIAFNLVESYRLKVEEHELSTFNLQFVSGLSASIMAVFLGNLGTIQMIFQGFQRMSAPGGIVPADTALWQKWIWAFKGIFLTPGGALPLGRGEWYWNPSRVIPPGPGNEITEFPLFTFLYSDMHAHMLVIPLTLFIIAWAVSFVKSQAKMSRVEWITSFAIGALMIGALKPTNTWDLYTFFPFTALAVIYSINRHFEWKERFKLSNWLGRILFSIGAVLALYILGSLMYSPFSAWYGQAYNKVDPWVASHTPISSYFTHWGLFLFIISAWLIWEMREWMAETPLSHLKRLRPYSLLIEIGLAFILSIFAYFIFKGAHIIWLALPLAVMAGLLMLRPDMPAVKRSVLLMMGTGLALTMAVEVITLRGDIGRMNTIFKLYMQVWILFSVSSAAAFGWLLSAFPQWTFRWRAIYQTGLYLLLGGAFMFTITAATDKITDRLTPSAPHSLDSMTYMNFSQHWDGNIMDLSEDYRAIRWMQDNVQGSPVIVEANCTEYRWCTRYTIYTGLPGVIGWNWHQRQQRALIAPNLITDRVAEIGTFYTTTDLEWAHTFLKKYQVKYIIVGQLERNIYPIVEGVPDGLVKFQQDEGKYWKAVYHDKNTTIYEVIP